ncbi:MAG: hypothetical protein SFZ03_10100 [Candidatus Melainabacteria bacterium]|nr:hypothetical protein [Candidatus Melainabacteria bacterium]
MGALDVLNNGPQNSGWALIGLIFLAWVPLLAAWFSVPGGVRSALSKVLAGAAVFNFRPIAPAGLFALLLALLGFVAQLIAQSVGQPSAPWAPLAELSSGLWTVAAVGLIGALLTFWVSCRRFLLLLLTTLVALVLHAQPDWTVWSALLPAVAAGIFVAVLFPLLLSEQTKEDPTSQAPVTLLYAVLPAIVLLLGAYALPLLMPESQDLPVIRPLLLYGVLLATATAQWLNGCLSHSTLVSTQSSLAKLALLVAFCLLAGAAYFVLLHNVALLPDAWRWPLLPTIASVLLLVWNHFAQPPRESAAQLPAAGETLDEMSDETSNQTSDETCEARPTSYSGWYLLLVGSLTLVADRLYGPVGMGLLWLAVLLVGDQCVTSVRRGLAVAGLFWLMRLVLAAYLLQFNSNVTGINLLHPYPHVALLLGVLVPLMLPGVFQRFLRWQLPFVQQPMRSMVALAVFIALVAIGLPWASAYFLHAEPTGALLIGASLSLLAVAVLNARQCQLQVLAVAVFGVFWVLFAVLGQPLLALGAEATREARLWSLIVLGLIVLLHLWSSRAFWSPSDRQTPVAISGDA